LDTFIYAIIQVPIRLTDYAQMRILAENVQGAVRGSSIYYNMLDVWVILPQYALHGLGYVLAPVQAWRDDGNERKSLVHPSIRKSI
jgi:hypothetical protein